MIKQLSSPRLFFTNEELSTIRHRLTSSEPNQMNINFQAIGENLLQKANQYTKEDRFTITYPNAPTIITMNYPIQISDILNLADPPGYTEYPFWTQVSLHIKTRLETLTKAYCLTNQKEYLEKAKDILISLCRFGRWFEFPSKGALWSLSLPIITMCVSFSYDLLYHELSSDEKTIVEDALQDKGLKLLFKLFGTSDQHNIFVAGMSAMMIAALCLKGRKEDMDVYVNEAERYFSNYLDAKLNRRESEGLHYDTVALHNIVKALYANHRITGNSLINHPYLTKDILNQIFYFQGCGNQATFANFSDSYTNLDVTSLLVLLSNTCKSPILYDYLRKHAYWSEDVLFYLKNADEYAASPDDVEDFPTSKIFPSIGWAALRSGWKNHTHMLGFTSSPSERDHNHFDQNNITVNVSGEWLLTNPGYQDYVPGPRRDFTIGTIGHNCMLVNGKGQTTLGKSSIKQSLLTPFLEYVEGSVEHVYEIPLLWNRKIFHINKTNYLVIDDVESDQNENLKYLFHSLGQWIEQSQVSYRLYGENHGLDLKFLHPKLVSSELKEFEGAESYGKYLELSVKSQEGPTITWINPLYGKAEEGTCSFINLPVKCKTDRLLERKAANYPYVYFHSQKLEDQISFTYSCEKDGDYFLYYRPYLSHKQGIYEVEVNGRIAATIDGYYEFELQGPIHDLGKHPLRKGKNTISFRVIEKNEQSSNYHIGMAELFIKNEALPESVKFRNETAPPHLKRTEELIILNWKDRSTNTFVINLLNSGLNFGKDYTDAQYFYQIKNRWGCINGSYLLNNNIWLVSKETCSFAIEKEGDLHIIWISSGVQQQIYLAAKGTVQSVKVNESLIDVKNSSELRLVIDKGEHQIQLRI
jgi:Heparinase II/III-like protein